VKKLLAVCFLLPSLAAAAPDAPSLREKMAAILRAEDRRSAVGLAELLRDPQPSVRRRAAYAAGRIGDPALTLTLVDRLGDPVPEVRSVAAFALGLIGDAKAAPKLSVALKDHDPVVRARAAEAIGRLGDPHAAPVVAQMVVAAVPKGVAPLAVRGDDAGNPDDPWLELRLGLFALGALKDIPSAASALLESGRSRFDWWAATWVAAALPSPELTPVLVAAASSTDRWSRALAADGLGRVRSPQAITALTKLVQDRDETVAARAVRALGATGDASAVAAIEPLLRATGPSGARVKLAALQALALLPASRKSRDDVVALAGHEDAEVRGAAMRVLARLDPAQLALVLSGSGRDPVWSVRAGLAAGLAGGHDEFSLGMLYSLLKDDDARVAAAALEALTRSLGSEATLTLVQQLGHSDPGVRAAAARGLQSLGDTTHSAELAAAYRRSMDDREPEARLALINALALTHDSATSDVLNAAAKDDPARSVRATAVRALVLAGQPAPSLEPEPAGPGLDYTLAMAPYDPGARVYTPRAFVHTRRGTIEIRLNSLEAPLACDSFIALARRGFFDDLEFYRVLPGVRVDSGCPRGDGLGGPGYRLRREAGMRPFGRGAVGLDAPEKDAEGSRFFIALAPDPERDGRATLLGTVTSGLEVLDSLRAQDTIDDVEIWD
jgi:HEAT repeat protein